MACGFSSMLLKQLFLNLKFCLDKHTHNILVMYCEIIFCFHVCDVLIVFALQAFRPLVASFVTDSALTSVLLR